MRNFYAELSAGRDAGDALRMAKLQYLQSAGEEERHPFYWAAFVLNGDGYLQLPRVVSLPIVAAAAMAAVGIGLLLTQLARKRKAVVGESQ